MVSSLSRREISEGWSLLGVCRRPLGTIHTVIPCMGMYRLSIQEEMENVLLCPTFLCGAVKSSFLGNSLLLFFRSGFPGRFHPHGVQGLWRLIGRSSIVMNVPRVGSGGHPYSPNVRAKVSFSNSSGITLPPIGVLGSRCKDGTIITERIPRFAMRVFGMMWCGCIGMGRIRLAYPPKCFKVEPTTVEIGY